MAYGTVNADIIQSSVSGVSLGAGNASIMKNRIINGAMVIDQRNAGASLTIPATTVTYTLDRYYAYSTQASKFSVQQNAGAVTPPVGFTNYLGVTSLSAYSVTSTDQLIINQAVEGLNSADLGWGTANAQTVTLSFWVRSSLTGTFAGGIINGNSNRSYPFTYSIPVANTWTAISVTVAGDTTGTWATNNTAGINISFCLGAGSTFQSTANTWAAGNFKSVSGAVNIVGTSGATFYITGVQLEVGSSATGFEYRQYQQELALCQRYFYRPSPSNSRIAFGTWNSTTTADLFVPVPVSMRAVPSITATSNGQLLNYGVAWSNITAFNIHAEANTNLIGLTATVASSGAAQGKGAALGGGGGLAPDYLFSAEL